jgi:hypothetical protein
VGVGVIVELCAVDVAVLVGVGVDAPQLQSVSVGQDGFLQYPL